MTTIDGQVPKLIRGMSHSDERGTLTYFNDFDFLPARRCYIIQHPDVSVVRAWQGHQHERKWFHVVSGSFRMVIVKVDNWISPSHKLLTEEFQLSETDRNILHVPGGYANGFQALHPGSKMIVFSDMVLEDSMSDSFRFDRDLWYRW